MCMHYPVVVFSSVQSYLYFPKNLTIGIRRLNTSFRKINSLAVCITENSYQLLLFKITGDCLNSHNGFDSIPSLVLPLHKLAVYCVSQAISFRVLPELCCLESTEFDIFFLPFQSLNLYQFRCTLISNDIYSGRVSFSSNLHAYICVRENFKVLWNVRLGTEVTTPYNPKVHYIPTNLS